jgi:rhodanese-related sulfurtransferase
MNDSAVILFSLLVCIFSAVLPSKGQAAETGYQEITAPELKIMLEEKKCLLINALSKIEFEIQHIEGSINIPVVDMHSTTKLPADKSTPLVFYCMGTR